MVEAKLIEALAADLRPVRRLWPPWLRTLCWVAVLAAGAVGIAVVGGFDAFRGAWRRLAETADLGVAAFGAFVTAIAAAAAAFQTSIPGRSPHWAWLPAPGLLLWICASGAGCLREQIAPGAFGPAGANAPDCLFFIVGVSAPLSALLFMWVRRACPLHPSLTAGLGGLAAAAGAAALLNLCHPYDAAASDLAAHAAAVALVIACNRGLGGVLLNPAAQRAWRLE